MKIKQIEERLKLKFIGTIELSEECYVSDPCYNVGTWCQYQLKNMLPGKYHCFLKELSSDETGGWGDRIGSLYIFHENYMTEPKRIIHDADVGVDSGQAGFYDSQYFIETRDNKQWYQEVCEMTYTLKPNPYYISDEDLCQKRFAKSTDELNTEELVEFLSMLSENSSILSENDSREFVEKSYGAVKDNLCAVSSTGYGDGCYRLYVGENNKKQVVSAKIRYI